VEKKRHTVKNTVISTPNKIVLFLGQTFQGYNHDFNMLKKEFSTDIQWFESVKEVLVDLGYLGIRKEYGASNVKIPNKKTRKSKVNPTPKLTEEEKSYNKALSKVRIFVENAIGGIKKLNILTHIFRNRRNNFVDDVIAISAGLWNLKLGATIL